MRNLARRAGRFAMVPVLAGAAVFAVAAPAAAAPPAPPQPAEVKENCGEPVDGTTVCLIWGPGGVAGPDVTAVVRRAEGKLKGALVVVEACDTSCRAMEVGTGAGKREVRTPPHVWGRGAGYYRANASWVDDKGQTHTGVVNPE
jgi:hypothetical protein